MENVVKEREKCMEAKNRSRKEPAAGRGGAGDGNVGKVVR